MRTPAAEVTVTAGLVESLLRDQHPDLAGLPVTEAANGWDNALFRLGEDLCVRLPRRALSSESVLNEQRWLGPIAERVGVPVPVPVRTGGPGRGFPWHWSVSQWFEGRVAAELPAAARRGLARPLAAFVSRVHVPAPAEAPRNPVRGVPLDVRTERVLGRLATGTVPRSDELRSLWRRLVATPVWPGPPLWLHGDLHPANILATSGDPAGLAAVLDFGDLTAGDPATDLAAAWLVFDAPGRAEFRARLDGAGAVDRNTWARARAWAIVMGTAVAVSSADHPLMASVGEHALTQVLDSGAD